MANGANTVADAILGVELKGVGDIAKQLKDGVGGGVKEMDSIIRKAGKTFSDTVKKASDDAFGSGAMKRLMGVRRELRESSMRAAQAYNDLREKGVKEEEKKRLKGIIEQEKIRSRELLKRMNTEAKAVQKHGRVRRAVMAGIDKQMDRASQARVDSLSSGIESAFEGFKGMTAAGAVRGIGAGVSGAGRGIGAIGKKVGGGADATKAMKNVASAIKGVGVAVAGIGAVIGIVALLIKIFFDLDAKVKEYNKTLLESGGIADLTFKRGYSAATGMKEALDGVRHAATDMSNNLRWMTEGKEQYAILSAFNEAGFRIKDMTKDISNAADEMQRYQDVTSVALTYSKLLGVEATKVATDMGTIMADTGLQLDQVQEGFAKVARIAQESGFNTKRFYTTIIEATSGTHFYNVRIEEAASLLKTFSDILGKKPGTEFFKGMEAGFAEMSYKERFKQIMVTGGKATRQILDAEAKKAADRFAETMNAEGSPVRQALANIGIDIGAGAGAGRNLAEAVGKMNEKQFSKVVAQLRINEGLSGEQIQEITRLRELQKGASGSLGNQAKALDDLSYTGTLAMKMTSFMGKSLHEYSAVQLAAFEDFKGISGNQLESLIRMSRDFHGSYSILQEQAAAVKKGNAEGVAQGEVLSKELQEQTKRLGFAVDEQGQIRKATVDDKGSVSLGEKIDNVQEFIVNQNRLAEEAAKITKEELTKDQQIAQEIARNTEPLSKILSIGIEGWLMKIYDVMKPVSDILIEMVGLMPGGSEIKAQLAAEASQRDMLEATRDSIEAAREALNPLQDQQKKLTEMIGIAEQQGDTAFVESMTKELQKLNEMQADLETTIAVQTGKEKLVAGMEGQEFMAGGGGQKKILEYLKGAMEKQEGAVLGAQETNELQEKNNAMVEYFNKYYQTEADKQAKAAKEKAEADKKAAAEQKERDQKQLDETKKLPGEIADAQIEASKEDALYTLLSELGVGGDTIEASLRAGTAGALAKQKLGGAAFTSLSASDQAFVRTLAAEARVAAPPVQAGDFLYTDSGRLIQPSSADSIMGFAPGGPIEKALSGGGVRDINVNIYESFQTEKTYRVVKRVLREAGLV